MTLKMTTAQVVETSVTVTNSSFQNYTHPDDHTTRTTDTPGFKPFTNFNTVKPKWKHNLSREDRAELAQLRDNELVRVLNNDKNLGPALMATEWVRTETMKHLNDPNSYTVVSRGLDCQTARGN